MLVDESAGSRAWIASSALVILKEYYEMMRQYVRRLPYLMGAPSVEPTSKSKVVRMNVEVFDNIIG
jgi:hypothetical protein